MRPVKYCIESLTTTVPISSSVARQPSRPVHRDEHPERHADVDRCEDPGRRLLNAVVRDQ
jgi:hypothetical protein